MEKRIALWLLVICLRLRGKGTEEARQIAASGLPDEVPEKGLQRSRLVRNVVWLAANSCSLAILLVTLKGLSPWIRYPLAIVGAFPLTIAAALILVLLPGICIAAVSGWWRSK
jgi:hypothetical protein